MSDKIIEQLNAKLAVDGAIAFDAGESGLPRVLMTAADGSSAHVYLHGAHVAHYQPANASPVLFTSAASHFEDGKAIRGGVPVCFPWFAAKADDPDAPGHGLARTRSWKLRSAARDANANPVIELVLEGSPSMRQWFAHAFEAVLTVTLSDALTIALTVTHTGSADAAPLTYEAALHTYYVVSDVRNVSLHGLEGAPYLDKVNAGQSCTQADAPLTFTGETDSVYTHAGPRYTIDDPGLSRIITIDKSASASTIVWNPWIAKAASMGDFGDNEWPGMLCVETANVGAHAITLSPGASHTMAVTSAVAPR